MPRNPGISPNYFAWRRELESYGYDPDDLRLPPLCRDAEAFEVEQYAETCLVSVVAQPSSRGQRYLVAAVLALGCAFVLLCLYGLVTVGVP